MPTLLSPGLGPLSAARSARCPQFAALPRLHLRGPSRGGVRSAARPDGALLGGDPPTRVPGVPRSVVRSERSGTSRRKRIARGEPVLEAPMTGTPGLSRLLVRGGPAALLTGTIAAVVALLRMIRTSVPRFGPRCLAVAATTSCLAAATPVEPADAGRSNCRSTGRTVAVNSVGRVYLSRGSGLLRACSYRTGRSYSIDPGYSDPGLVRLSGSLVAYDDVDSSTRSGPLLSAVEITNLTTGRRRRVVMRDAALNATDLVLKPNGSFAEIRRVGPFDPALQTFARQVRRFDRRGKVVLDNTGEAISPRSLSLKRSVIRWRRGGQARRATLR